MKAYLVGGPVNGREVELPDSQHELFMPQVKCSIQDFTKETANFNIVVYRRSFQLRNGGYVFEVDETLTAPAPYDLAKDLATVLRVNPNLFEDAIRRAVRGMNLKAM